MSAHAKDTVHLFIKVAMTEHAKTRAPGHCPEVIAAKTGFVEAMAGKARNHASPVKGQIRGNLHNRFYVNGMRETIGLIMALIAEQGHILSQRGPLFPGHRPLYMTIQAQALKVVVAPPHGGTDSGIKGTCRRQ